MTFELRKHTLDSLVNLLTLGGEGGLHACPFLDCRV